MITHYSFSFTGWYKEIIGFRLKRFISEIIRHTVCNIPCKYSYFSKLEKLEVSKNIEPAVTLNAKVSIVNLCRMDMQIVRSSMPSQTDLETRNLGTTCFQLEQTEHGLLFSNAVEFFGFSNYYFLVSNVFFSSPFEIVGNCKLWICRSLFQRNFVSHYCANIL